jgi:hypothetical protein
LPFLTTLTMNSSEDFLVISTKWCSEVRSLGRFGSRWVVDCLSSKFTWFLATWRPEITRWRMKFHDGFEDIPISLQ